jgi:hypothetical protein
VPGKSSACMYPYAEQLLEYLAGDPARKDAALILEVKRGLLPPRPRRPAVIMAAATTMSKSVSTRRTATPAPQRPGGLRAGVRYRDTDDQPVWRGKEPFWQQASTNLVKFVIFLHQTVDDLRHALPSVSASSTRTSFAPSSRKESDALARARDGSS